jgi:hypothetical protein
MFSLLSFFCFLLPFFCLSLSPSLPPSLADVDPQCTILPQYFLEFGKRFSRDVYLNDKVFQQMVRVFFFSLSLSSCSLSSSFFPMASLLSYSFFVFLLFFLLIFFLPYFFFLSIFLGDRYFAEQSTLHFRNLEQLRRSLFPLLR